MEILVVKNPTTSKNLGMLVGALANHNLTIVEHHPEVAIDPSGKDLVVLSGGGGNGKEATDTHHGRSYYEPQRQLIREGRVPVLGVCLGMQIGCDTFGAPVLELPEPHEGLKTVRTYSSVLPREIRQTGSHDFYVPLGGIPSELEIMATSTKQTDAGAISIAEGVRSRDGSFLGLQIHPERPGEVPLDHWVHQLVA